MRRLHRPEGRKRGGGGGWYINADPGSILACGVNLVSGPLADVSDLRVEQHSRPKSHYQIERAQHFPPE